MLLSYQYVLLYLHHTRVKIVCCLPSSFYSVLKPIKITENIVVKGLLDNAFMCTATR